MTKNQKALLSDAFGEVWAVKIMLKNLSAGELDTKAIAALVNSLERAGGLIQEVTEDE